MWWVKTNSTGEERGGFQNRDVGKSSFDNNYGPDFGIDYARFSDPPDITRDLKLKHLIIEQIGLGHELIVRNGFVIVKGKVPDEKSRLRLLEKIHSFDQVREVISDLKIEEFP